MPKVRFVSITESFIQIDVSFVTRPNPIFLLLAGDYNCTEPNPEIQTIMAVLSGGPVGPGDRLNLTDKSMVLHACTAAGKIVRPDRPLAPLDITFQDYVNHGYVATIWSSYSTHQIQNGNRAHDCASWHYIFVSDLPIDRDIYPKDFLTVPDGCGVTEDMNFVAIEIVKQDKSGLDANWSAQAERSVHFINSTTPLSLPAADRPPPFSCPETENHTEPYCIYKGKYCDGIDRREVYEGQYDSEEECEAKCTADTRCTCFSYSQKPRHPNASKCRVYNKANKLSDSKNGYDAYVKRSEFESSERNNVGAIPFTYWLLVPIFESGFAIVGELDKVVPVSRKRFQAFEEDTDLVMKLSGEPGETVDFAYIPPAGKQIVHILCTIDAPGILHVTCNSENKDCRCT